MTEELSYNKNYNLAFDDGTYVEVRVNIKLVVYHVDELNSDCMICNHTVNIKISSVGEVNSPNIVPRRYKMKYPTEGAEIVTSKNNIPNVISYLIAYNDSAWTYEHIADTIKGLFSVDLLELRNSWRIL